MHAPAAADRSDDGGMTPDEKRAAAAERKRKSRANKPDAISLPLPTGTHAALQRVMAAADFDDPRDFLAFQIHRLDDLLKCDGHSFTKQTKRTVTVGNLDKFFPRLIDDEQ